MDQPRIVSQIPSEALDKFNNNKGAKIESQKQPENDVKINLEPEGFAVNNNKKRFG